MLLTFLVALLSSASARLPGRPRGTGALALPCLGDEAPATTASPISPTGEGKEEAAASETSSRVGITATVTSFFGQMLPCLLWTRPPTGIEWSGVEWSGVE